MKIICLINEKGGVGKSTLAANLGTSLHRAGRTVVLVDADPQGTLRDWRAASPAGANLPTVIAVDRPQLLASLPSMAADFLIIDTPAKAELAAATAIRISDVALVVIQPSGPDIWSSSAVVKLLHQKTEMGGEIDAAFLVNRVSLSTTLSRQVRGGEWNSYGIAQLDASVGNRASFARSMTDGFSVYELGDSLAKAEIDSVIQELEAAKWL